MERRAFSREFKLEAVKQVVEGRSGPSQVAREIGIHVGLLQKWLRQFRGDADQAFPGKGKMKPADEELARVKRELNRVTAERDILKKALGYFAKEPK